LSLRSWLVRFRERRHRRKLRHLELAWFKPTSRTN
jgi:hypothetical protein